MNKKEGIPKGTIRMVRSLEIVEKKSTSSGSNKPKGKNDTYLQKLKGYVSKITEHIYFLASESKTDVCVDSKSNKIR